nr:M20/M25/M40 family metallo-hydrolase [Eubacteriales bacterium]
MFDIDRAVDENMEGLVRDIKRLVAHYSVQGEPSEGKPFGDGPAEAVAEAEKIASELGFVTKNYDNYALTAEMGEGESLVGIIGHLDVVPVGEGWEHDPFSGEIVDGVMYGRGVTDDKGPSLAALYAMKIVRDSGLPVT